MSIEGPKSTNERCPVCVNFGVNDSFLDITPTGAKCTRGQHTWNDSFDLLAELNRARADHREMYPQAKPGDANMITQVVIDDVTKQEIEGQLGKTFTSGPHLKGLIFSLVSQVRELEKKVAEGKGSSPALRFNEFVVGINEGLLGGIFQEATARHQRSEEFISMLFSEFLKQECFTLFKNEFMAYLENYVDPGGAR